MQFKLGWRNVVAVVSAALVAGLASGEAQAFGWGHWAGSSGGSSGGSWGSGGSSGYYSYAGWGSSGGGAWGSSGGSSGGAWGSSGGSSGQRQGFLHRLFHHKRVAYQSSGGSSGSWGAYGASSGGSSGSWHYAGSGGSSGSWSGGSSGSWSYGSSGGRAVSAGSSGGHSGWGYGSSGGGSSGGYITSESSGYISGGSSGGYIISDGAVMSQGTVISEGYPSGSAMGGTIVNEGTVVEPGTTMKPSTEASPTEADGNGAGADEEGASDAEPMASSDDVEANVIRQLQASDSVATSAILTVRVPSDANVYVNGHKTASRGSVRQYISRGLEKGQSYRYEVKAEFVRNGKTIQKTEEVRLLGGQAISVAFRAKNSDRQMAEKVRTQLKLIVPENAKVMLAGREMKASGSEREFSTYRLASGEVWTGYEVRVLLDVDGKVIERKQVIRLAAGDKKELNFDFSEQPAQIARNVR